MNLFDSFRDLTGAKQYKDALGKFSFQYKVNVKRNLRRKNAPYGQLLDLRNDFEVEENYIGPRLDSFDAKIIDEVVVWFAKNELLHRKYVYKILSLTEELFRQTPVLVEVPLKKDGNIHICGDIHGQYYDLLKIFREKGPPGPDNLFLFNGDIVDKGPMSLECILLLFLLKLTQPAFVFINRGNHESALINMKNGFAKEIKAKYDDFFLFQFFGEVFRWMPIVHLIEGRIMVMHGGLSSKKDLRLQEVKNIKRPVEPHENTLVGELLWSDPQTELGTCPSSRGIGVFFGPNITNYFLEKNDLMCLIRSHSEIKEGCGMNHPGCYTVYSAPNAAKGILGGILTLDGKYLNKEGMVFSACSEQEIEAFNRKPFFSLYEKKLESKGKAQLDQDGIYQQDIEKSVRDPHMK